MKNLIVLCGPAGVGKSTYASKCVGYTIANQDKQCWDGHMDLFEDALAKGFPIVVDRMNFNKEQRYRYLAPAKEAGYNTNIVIFHESKETCFKRCIERQGHETIKNEVDAGRALEHFFNKYEQVDDSEADGVMRLWPEGLVKSVVWCDLDGTLCNTAHRQHFLERKDGTKRLDWKKFFEDIEHDTVNVPVMECLKKLAQDNDIVYCSGRPETYKAITETWLEKNGAPKGLLFMRGRNDMRSDTVVKEIMLDFDVLTRYKDVLVCFDDRNNVVKMLRNRGLTVFQVAEGNF
jgi:predicted kinase